MRSLDLDRTVVGTRDDSDADGTRVGIGPGGVYTNRQLMQAILHNKVQIAKAVNATVIPLDQAPKGYKDFDLGAAKKFVIDPHHSVAA